MYTEENLNGVSMIKTLIRRKSIFLCGAVLCVVVVIVVKRLDIYCKTTDLIWFRRDNGDILKSGLNQIAGIIPDLNLVSGRDRALDACELKFQRDPILLVRAEVVELDWTAIIDVLNQSELLVGFQRKKLFERTSASMRLDEMLGTSLPCDWSHVWLNTVDPNSTRVMRIWSNQVPASVMIVTALKKDGGGIIIFRCTTE
jgi:hypothetical protein